MYSLEISFSGDLMLGRYVRETARVKGLPFLLDSIKTIYSDYGYNVVNLECAITGQAAAINKQYTFRGDTLYPAILKDNKITHAILANNHSYDYGEVGLLDTYRHLIKAKITPIGISNSKLSDCEPVLIENDGNYIAIYSSVILDVNPPKGSLSICKNNIESLSEKIKQFKLKNTKYNVLVTLHWGVEYAEIPTNLQKKQARDLIDSGADAIIGHHPHVVQNIEFYKDKPIIYSLGNLVFDQHYPNTEKGIIAGLNFNKNKIQDIRIHPLIIERCKPSQMDLIESKDFINKIISNSSDIIVEYTDKSWILTPKENKNLNYKNEIYIEDDYFNGYVELYQMKTINGVKLIIKDKNMVEKDAVLYKYESYRLDVGDIDNNGATDIILGIIKNTYIDPNYKKRLFILKIDDSKIRPLWLGSNVCGTIVDFKAKKSKNKTTILVIEEADNNLFSVGDYFWDEFGLTLSKYLVKNINLKQAYEEMLK